MSTFSRIFLWLLLCTGLVSFMSGQDLIPRLSPKGNLRQVVGNTVVEIEYERPSARGRVIYGGLVPWDQVWRTGAGKCTKVSFDQAVKVGKQAVPAGIYSLFTIPGPETWMVILNRDTSLYGSYDYDPALDVARFKVKPETTKRHYETLTIDIDPTPNDARIYISWVHTQISFLVETGADEVAMKYIYEEVMTGKESDPDQYASAASYLFSEKTNLQDAIRLTDMAIERNAGTWSCRVQMEIYEYLGDLDAAIEACNKGIALRKANPLELEEDNKRALAEWQAHIDRLVDTKEAEE